LSSYVSDFSVSIPDGETGPPQATPIIGDNGNHSSGYHGLPIESIEDKIRRLTPLRFLPLINQLLLARSNGIEKASSSAIAIALLQYDKDICKHAGVNHFGDYASLAERASLIEMGGWEGQAWIALHPRWFKEDTTPKSSTPSSSIRTPPPPNLVSRAAARNFASRAVTRNLSTPPHPPAVSDEPMPFCFYPLIKCSEGWGGKAPPFISRPHSRTRSICYSWRVQSETIS
jgi:hypothetical protein